MKHALSLGLLLYGLWCTLSGYLQLTLLGLGLASCLFVVFVALRMGLVDRRWPLHHRLFSRVLGYWLWLIGQVIGANIDVIRRILDPRLPISPTWIWVKASQRTDIGRVTYANSITITPGTLAVELQGNAILVHALCREAAQALAAGTMDRRISAMERTAWCLSPPP